MAHEPVEEVSDLGAKLLGLGVELIEGLGHAVGDLHVAALELSDEA